MTAARRALLVLVVPGCLVLVTAGLLLRGRPERAAPVQRPPGSLAPRTGALLGAWVTPPGDFTAAGRREAVTRLEADLGRRLDIDHHFYPWSKPFPTEDERWDLRQGRIPMISWGGTDTIRVASGAEDGLIRARADAVRALGRPVLLRWFWEMDGRRHRHVVHSPAQFVAAWRHLRAIFAAEGANNVRWVWCPNAIAFAKGTAAPFYPGDTEVDWVCADGYYGPSKHQSFAQIFEAFHRWGARTGKPLMIGEFGATEHGDGEKARWLRDASAALKIRLPRIAAVIYFDAAKQGYDWRVATTPTSFQAFKAMATDPYFQQRG